MTALDTCLRLRALGYRPDGEATVDGARVLLMSYPYPAVDGSLRVLARTVADDPRSAVSFRIPTEAIDLVAA